MTTQKVFASYQEIIDLHTESDKVSILGFHTPCNEQPVHLLEPFWRAYQRVKYLGCSMALVPAARLPADPSQVSYEGGELQIDPRDLLNPILFHGCHGNDMGSVLNQFYSGEILSTDVERLFSDSMDHNMLNTARVGDGAFFTDLYYRALTDNTWLKAHPQRGFRKNMRPMVYNLAVNTPLNPVAGGTRYPSNVSMEDDYGEHDGSADASEERGTLGNNPSNSYISGTQLPGLQQSAVNDTSQRTTISASPTYSGIAFMTPGIRPLGWIDTRQPVSGGAPTLTIANSQASDEQAMAGTLDSFYYTMDKRFARIPKVFMGLCMLPPAYKTEQYFRIVLNHHFAFAKYRGISMGGAVDTPNNASNVVNMN